MENFVTTKHYKHSIDAYLDEKRFCNQYNQGYNLLAILYAKMIACSFSPAHTLVPLILR